MYVPALLVIAAIGALGVRLLLMWRRTTGLPELLLALFFILSGPCGFLLIASAEQPALQAMLPPALLRAIGAFAINAALVVMAVFTWRVFRPDERWAERFVLAIAALLAGVWVWRCLAVGFPEEMRIDANWVLGTTVRALVFAWSGGEAFRYWAAMRRRARLGLADPVVANRFLLWGIWVGAGALVLVVRVLRITVGLDTELRMAIIAGLGLVSGVAIWLTFFPPRAYLRRVAGAAA